MEAQRRHWLDEVQSTYEDAFYVPQINSGGVNGAVYTWYDGQDPQRARHGRR